MPDGFGIWAYGDFRYEGEWKDGKPNGQGTLYEPLSPPANKNPDMSYPLEITLFGNYTDGFANGPMAMVWYMDNGQSHTWHFTAAMGYAIEKEVYSSTSEASYEFSSDDVFGVPPWIN
jgi:hypothetical protein